jgi:hypothetical protein
MKTTDFRPHFNMLTALVFLLFYMITLSVVYSIVADPVSANTKTFFYIDRVRG